MATACLSAAMGEVRRLAARVLLGLCALVAGLALADAPAPTQFPNTGAFSAKLKQTSNNVAVVELTGDYSRNLPSGDVNVEPRTVIAKEFYRSFADKYDFIVAFSNFEFNTGDAKAFYLGVKNDVQGLGDRQFDNSAFFGSRSVLQGWVDMAALSRYNLDPSDPRFEEAMRVLSHEILHRWAARVRYIDGSGQPSAALLGRDGSHWSFLLDTGGSVEYGNRWADNGDGSFTSKADRQFFSPLDLYLMGMLKKEEVPPFFLIHSPGVDATRLGEPGVTISGQREDISIDQVIAANGPRQPSADDSQKQFRIGFVLLTRPGQGATDLQVQQVDAVRQAFETRLTALTGGRALAHVFIEPKGTGRADEPTVPGSTPGAPGSKASLFTALDWLRAHQQAQGSWFDNPLTRMRDTTVAAAALADLGSADQPNIDRALNWLSTQTLYNTDYLARRILALGSRAAEADWARLASLQNTDGGWGVALGYQSTPLDTALAVSAFAQDPNTARQTALRAKAKVFLLGKQNPDGGWSHAVNGASRTATTTQVMRALASLDAAPQLQAAALFLAGRQNVDGGFGDSPSTTHDTANVMLTLAAAGQMGAVRSLDAFNFLNATQQPDGSWDGSVYATGLTARALGVSQTYNWTVTTLSATPDAVRDGQRVALAVSISNTGTVAAPATTLRVYDGDPSAGVVVVDLPVPPLDPGKATVLRGSWSTTDKQGNHLLAALADPAAAGTEMTRSDNTATARVAVAAAPVQADLSVATGDVQVMPSIINRLPTTVSVLAQVSNIGRTDAAGVKVRLLSGSSADAMTVVDEKLVNLLGRSSVPVSTSFQVTKPGRQLLAVVLDPDGAVQDIDRSNNRADLVIDTVSTFDPAVAAGDLVVPQTPVTLGSDVALKATLHNLGTADSPPFQAVFTVSDGTTVREIERTSVQLQAGTAKTLTLPWRVDLTGTLEFKVMLDPAATVVDLDRSNNEARATFSATPPPSGPNLAVNFRDFSISPDPANEGRPLTLKALVRNTGTQAASQVEVGFYEGDPANGGVLLAPLQTLATLAAGATVEVTAQVANINGTAQRLYFVVADPANKITEVDKDDNKAFRDVMVNAMADLAVSSGSITLTPAMPRPGDALSVAVEVQNLGQQSANAVLVRLLDGGTVLGEQTLASVAPQAKAVARFSLNLPAQSAARSLTVVVDPDNTVQESNKGNNSATRLLAVQDGNGYVSEPFFSPNGDGVKDTVSFAFRVDNPTVARVVVVDGSEQVVRSFGNLGSGPVSEGSITWDGRDDDQRLANDGSYRLRALSADGTVLAESSTVLDTNRTPILRASGTSAEYYRNLSCRLPSYSEWTSTQDEQSLFAYSDAQNQQGIYRIALQGGEVSTVVPTAFVQAGATSLNDLSASARGDQLAFRRWNYQTGDEVWVVNGDGSGLRKVMSSATEGSDGYQFSQRLVMSHDASALVAMLQMKDNRTVIRRHPLAPVGAPPTILYDPKDNENRTINSFVIAPNRRRAILATSYDTNVLVLLDLETGVQTPAPADLYQTSNWWGVNVSWAPDSRHVVVYGQVDQMGVEPGNRIDYEFDVFDADFKLVKRFRTNVGPNGSNCDCSGGQVSSVEWSSNGLEILFAHEASQYGGEATVATRAAATSAVVGNDGVARSFYRIDIGKGTMTQLDVDPNLWQGSIPLWWAPNDRLAAFAPSSWNEQQLYSVNVDTSDTATLFPKWQDTISNPNGAPMSVANFAPSGRRLFFSSYRDSNNIQSACYSPSGGMQLFAYESLQNLVADLQALRDPRVGGLLLSGTAADINFAGYQLEYANTKTPNDWRPVSVPGNEEKFGVRLTNWIPPSYGSFFVRLTVSDRAGNTAVSQRRVNWSDTPAITDVIKDLDYFSPNGDGIQDSVKLSYRVVEPVHLAFEVVNADGQRVRLLERDHATIGGSFAFEWDGRNDAGQVVADGKYTIRVLDYEFPVEVDTVAPQLSLQSSDHAFDYRLPFDSFSGVLSFDSAATLGAVPALEFAVLDGTVNVDVRDGMGRSWRSFSMGIGAQRLEWDGQDDSGKDLPAGAYEVSFERGGLRIVSFVAELNRGPSGVDVQFRPVRLPVSPTPLTPLFSIFAADRLLDPAQLQVEQGWGDPPAQWQYLFKDRTVQSLPKGVAMGGAAFSEDADGLNMADLRGSIGYLQYSGSRVRATAADKAGNVASQVSDYHPVREIVLLSAGADYWPPDDPARTFGAPVSVGSNFTGTAVPITPASNPQVPKGYQLGSLSLAFMDNLLQRSPRAELRYAFLRKPVAKLGEPEPEPRPMPAPTEQDMRLLQWTAVPLRGLLPSEHTVGVSELTDSAQEITLHWQLPHLDAGVWLVQLVQRDQDGSELRSNLYWVAQPVTPFSKPKIDPLGWKAYHEPALSCDAPVTDIAHVVYKVPAFDPTNFPFEVSGLRLYRVPVNGDRELISEVAASNRSGVIDFLPQFSTAEWTVGRHDFEIELNLASGWTKLDSPYLYVNHVAPTVRISAPLDGQKMCATQIKVPGVGTIGYVPMSVQVDEPYAANQDLQRLKADGSWQHAGPVGVVTGVLGAQATEAGGNLRVCTLPGGCDESGPLVWPARPGKFVHPTSGRLYGLAQGSDKDFALDPLDGQVTARLRAYGPSGHLVCTPVTVDVDGRVEGGATLDRSLFSPNGDGNFDEVVASVTALEALKVRIEVVRGSLDRSGRLVAAEGAALALLVNDQDIDNGSRDYSWDGRDGSGQVVPDGQYALRVTLTDGCGNEKIILLRVVVDNTPPSIVIDTPRPNAQLPLELNIQGTVADVHPLRYEVAIVMDASPDAPINLPSLGGMNLPHVDLASLKALGLTGGARLVVQAYDQAGNMSRLEVPVQLAEPSELITSFNAAPDPFSPNGDGRRDKVSLFYTLARPAQLTLELQRVPSGQKIKTLLDKVAGKQGDSVLQWDGMNATGVVEPDEDVAAVLTAEVVENGSVTARQVARAGFVLDKTPPVITFSLPNRPVTTGAGGAVARAVDPLFSDASLDVSVNGAPYLSLAQSQDASGTVAAPLDDLPEGPITLRVKANDRAENASVSTLNVILDRTPPKVAITAPAANAFISGRQQATHVIEGSIDELHLARYTLSLNDQQLGTATTPPVVAALQNWSPLQFADGAYVIKLKAEDQAGLTGETSVPVTVDNTPPVALLKGAASGTNWLRVGSKILGTATDTNLQNYRLELSPGGAATGRWSELGRGTSGVSDGVLLTATALPADGVYGLRLTVVDKAGNESSAVLDVTVDTTPPQAVTLTAELKNSHDADVKWAAASQADVAGYILMRNGSRVSSALINATSYADANLAPGTYAYVVKAVDFAGNESDPSNEGRVVVSSSEPVAQIFVPVRDGYVAGLADVRGTAASPADFKEYRLFVGTGASPTTWQLLRRSPVPITADQLAQWNTVSSTDGAVYTLKLEAENLSGTVATDRVTVKVKNTPPKVPLLLHGTLSVNNIALGWTANTDTDLQGYLLYRDQRLANATGPVIGSLVPYLIKPTAYNDLGVPDGLHRYVVVAMDAAGNLSDPSNEVEFKVDTRPPHVPVTKPTDGNKVSGIVTLVGESPDSDISTVQFQYKPTVGGNWTNIGAPLTNASGPWTLSWNTEGLAYGSYQVRALATDDGNKTDPTPGFITLLLSDLRKPDPATDLKAGVQGGDVTLNWQPSPSSFATGYHVDRVNADQTVTRLTSTPLTVTTLKDLGRPDATYAYRVVALSQGGTESDISNTAYAVVFTPEFEQPLTPTPDASVSLTGVTRGLLHVQLQTQAGAAVAEVRSDEQGAYRFADLPLSLGDNRFQIVASDDDGNTSKTVFWHARRGVAPAAPTGLKTQVSDHNVNLSWAANIETDLLGYVPALEGQLRGGYVTPPSATASSSYPWGDYYAAYRAVDYDLGSGWRPTYYERLRGQWLEVQLGTQRVMDSVKLRWGELPNEYRVEAFDGEVWVPLAHHVNTDNAFDVELKFARPYRSDRLRVLILDPWDHGVMLNDVKVNVLEVGIGLSTAFNNLPDGKPKLGVKAVSTLGLISPLAEATPSVGDVTPPDAPVLQALAQGGDAQLTWTGPAAGDVAGFRVERDGVLIATLPDASVRAYLDPGLPNGSYSYVVTAVDRVGNIGLPSNAATVQIDVQGPSAPIAASAKVTPAGGSVLLDWTVGSGPQPAQFQLQRSLNAGGPYDVLASGLDGAQRSYVDSSVQNGLRYFYVVVGQDAQGRQGASSNEVNARPEDRVAPGVPYFVLPGRSPGPVITPDPSTDLIGYADPGSQVVITKGDQRVGVAQASSQDSNQYFFSNGNNQFDVTPDGRFVYFHGNAAAVYLADGTPVASRALSNLNSIYNVRLAPDGQSVALIYYSSNTGQTSLARWSRVDDRISDLPLNVTDGVLAFSPDGKTLAVNGYDTSGNPSVLLVDWASGNARLLNQQADNLSWSPDSKTLALGSASGLVLLDVVQGQSQTVPDVADVRSSSWLPDGSGLLADRSGAQGRRVIARVELPALTVQTIAEQDGVAYSRPVSAPDGSGYLALRDGNQLVLRGFDGSENALDNVIDGYGAPVWTQSRTIGYLRTWGQFLLRVPAGQFQLGGAALDPGSNLFGAYALDAAGNTSAPALPLEVRRLSDTLPDWTVGDDSWQVFPATPQVGDSVSIALTVKNIGAAAPATKVSVILVDAAGLITRLYSGPLAALERDGQQTLRLNWQPSQAGRYLMTAIVDPQDEQQELSKDNNQTTRELLVVTEAGRPELQVRTDKSRYQGGDTVKIDVSAAYAGAGFDGQLLVRLVDTAGFELTRFDTRAVQSLRFGVPQTFSFSWPSGATLAGAYRVLADLSDNGGAAAASASGDFSLDAGVQLAAQVATDHANYLQGDTVNVQGSLRYVAGNLAAFDSPVLLSLLSSTGDVVASRSLDLKGLLPGGEVRLDLSWVAAQPGDYMAVLRAGAEDAPTALAQAPLSVSLPSVPLVQGRLQLSGDAFNTDEVIPAQFTVSNRGALLDPLPVRVSAFDSVAGKVLATWTTQLPGVGTTPVPSDTVLQGSWPLGSFDVRLEAQVGSDWLLLDKARVRAIERVAPGIAFFTPAANTVMRSDADVLTQVLTRQNPVSKVEMQAADGSWQVMAVRDAMNGRYVSNTLPPADGPLLLKARATDSQGNVSTLAQLNVVIDNTPPTIMVTGVTGGQHYSGTALPVIAITDAHLLSSDVLLDGQPFVSGTAVTAPGSHALSITAADSAGNQSQQTLSFSVDVQVKLSGSLGVSPAQVPLGEAVALDVRIDNASAVALSGVQVTLVLRDRASGQVVQTFSDVSNLAVAGHYQHAWSWTATGTAGAFVDAQLSASVDGVSTPIATGSLQLAAPSAHVDLQLQLAPPTRLLVYVKCNRLEDDTWDNCGTALRSYSDAATIASCTSDRAAWLSQYLNARGVASTVVSDEASFLRELRSGRYGRYWLGGGALMLGSAATAELQAAVRRGDALLTEGWMPGHTLGLEALANVGFLGKWSSQQANVSTSGPLLPVATLLANKPVRLSTVTGTRQAVMNSGNGIVSSGYGQGRTMAFAFDLSGTLRAATDSTLPGWTGVVQAALDWLMPAARTEVAAGGVIVLQSSVGNTGTQALLLDYIAKLPSQAQALQAVPDATAITQEGGLPTLRWRANTAAGATAKFGTTLRAPMQAGDYLLPNLVNQVNGDGSSTLLQTQQQSLRVNGPIDLVGVAYDQVQALTLSGADAAAKAGTLGWLAQAKLSVADAHWDDALRQLIAAQASLQNLTGNAAEDAKLAIARAIEAVERRL